MNAIPGLPSSEFVAHKSPVESRKYFIAEAMDPNLVGEPNAIPLQFIKSSFVQYISPFSERLVSILSVFDEIFGTVLNFTIMPSSSAPSAMA